MRVGARGARAHDRGAQAADQGEHAASLDEGTPLALQRPMKKKTRRRLKKALKQLRASVPAKGSVMPAAATVGVLSAGGLLAAIAQDRTVKERGIALLHAIVDRGLSLLGSEDHTDLDPEEFSNVGGRDQEEERSH